MMVKVPSSVPRAPEVWGDTGSTGDAGRYGEHREMQGDAGSYGEIRGEHGDVERCKGDVREM